MSTYIDINSPRERENRMKRRQPGKVSSPYVESLKDRINFRNKMRYELKATAKESFVEELSQLRRNNQLKMYSENEKQFQLEQEVLQLRKMVDELKGNNHNDSNTNPLESHWAFMQSRQQYSSDRLDDSSSTTSFVGRNNSNYMPNIMSPLGKGNRQSNSQEGPKNGLFVLSCAPLQNFEDVVHSELSVGGNKAPTTLTQQIQQYNELQSLFALPSYESEFQNIYAMQRQHQLASRQHEPFSEPCDIRESKEMRLQTAIEKHKDRLQVSRELNSSRYSPRAPASPPSRAKSSAWRSPRGRSSHSNQRSRSPGMSYSAPSPQRNHRHHYSNGGEQLEVTSQLQLDANSSLKDIVRSTLNDHVAQSTYQENQHVKGTAASPVIKVQDLSVEEFKTITDKMKDDIHRLIENTVREELLADSKARRYTKRVEATALALHEQPLAQKIEAKIGDKISQLKNELASLRMTRLHLKPVDKQGNESSPSNEKFMSRRPNRGGASVDDDEDDDPRYGEDGDRPIGDNNWFSKNELESPINRKHGVDHIGETGLDIEQQQHRGSPHQQTGGGLDHMSRELLKSIEGILRRHIKESGGAEFDEYGATLLPSPHREPSMISQLTSDFDHDYNQQQLHVPMRGHSYSNSTGDDFHFKGGQPTGAVAPSKGGTSPVYNSARKFSLGLSDMFQQKPTGSTNAHHQQQETPTTRSPHELQHQKKLSNGSQLYTINDSHHDHSVTGQGDFAQRQTYQPPGGIPQQHPQLFQSQQQGQEMDLSGVPVLTTDDIPSSSSISVTSTKINKPSASQRVGNTRNLRQESVRDAQKESELKKMEAEYRGLMTNLLNVVDMKTNIKKELKVWNSAFEKENGRPPSDVDKAAINDKFHAYKMVSTQVSDLKLQIKLVEEKIKSLKEV